MTEVGETFVSVYMYRRDGTREVCIERMAEDAARRIYVRDSEGCCYTVGGKIDNREIARLDSAGKVQYTVPLGGSLWDFCALADGRLALLTSEGSSTAGGYHLFLLDPQGKLTAVFEGEKMNGSPVLGVSGDGLLMLLEDYVYRENLTDGKREHVYSFRQTAYTVTEVMGLLNDIQDFKMEEDGSFLILRSDSYGNGRCEEIRPVVLDKDRKDVVLRTVAYISGETWLKERILEFNNSQEEYRVVIDALEDGDDFDDFVTITGVELATGKGPEILMGSLLAGSADGLIEKGILMDLAPLMEQSGIREEDYFPATFDLWRTGDSIYCLLYDIWAQEQLMSTAILGDVREPSIGQLADAMLAYPEQAVYYGTVYGKNSAPMILTEFLQGSETLWGMIDWEKGTCDFGGELFGKLMEAAKRYQRDEGSAQTQITTKKYLSSFNGIYYNFLTGAESEAEGYVPIGFLFDDGHHPVLTTAQSERCSLMLNANAANRDGAWEFLKFLLSEEAQEKLSDVLLADMPVKKSVFRAQIEKEIKEGPGKNLDKSRMLFEGSLTRERADEIEAFLESARALPYKTEPVLEIIREESQDYFNGSKSIEQVADIIENRVQTYLDEQRKKK